MLIGALDFLVILAVLYLLECVKHPRAGEVVLDKRLGDGFGLKRPLMYPSERWGWAFLNPLRPNGPAFSLAPARYVFTRDGVLVADGALRYTLFVPFGDCQNPAIEDNGSVSLGEQVRVPTSSLRAAREFTGILAQLSKAKPADRLGRIQQFEKARFDAGAIKKRFSNLEERTVWLRRLASVQFVLCFGLFPAALLMWPLSLVLLSIAPVVLAVGVLTAMAYRRAAGELPADQSKVDFWGNFVKLIFYPVGSLRSVELLSWDFFTVNDPAAVLVALGNKKEAAEVVGKEVVGLRYRAEPGGIDDGVKQALREYRERRLETLEKFAARQGLTLKAVERPERMDATCRSYCPNCGAQYKFEPGVCGDCRDIELQTFE